MLKKPTRTILVVAIVVCVVVFTWSLPERPAQEGATPPYPFRVDAIRHAPGDVLPPTSSIGAAPVSPTPRASVAPVRLRVQAPTDVHVGQVFDARIELEADRGVRELLFTVTFAKSRLALVGWTEGGFAQQRGVASETMAQEPSDGNVQVTFRVSNGLAIAGAGTIVALQLEATRAGISSITVADVDAIGGSGSTERDVAILETGAVTIH